MDDGGGGPPDPGQPQAAQFVIPALDARGGLQVFDLQGNPLGSFLTDAPQFRGFEVAFADFNGDGVPDIVAAAGPDVLDEISPRVERRGAQIVIIDGATNIELSSFIAFPDETGGLKIATGDVTGDEAPEVVALSSHGQLSVFSSDGTLVESTAVHQSGSVAVGDVDGDGKADVIVGSGPNEAAKVSILKNLRPASEWVPGNPSFRGGVRVAVGDVNGDGLSEIIVGTGAGFLGGPRVTVFDSSGLELTSFFVVENSPFEVGGTVQVTDTNGDGKSEILVGTGEGDGGHIRIFDGSGLLISDSHFQVQPNSELRFGTLQVNGSTFVVVGSTLEVAGPRVRVFDGATNVVQDFLAFDSGFQGGVRVAAGDVTGDGVDDVIAAAGPGGGPHVRVFDGVSGAATRSFFAFDPSFAGGVRVAAADFDGDGQDDIVAAAGPHVKVIGATSDLASFFAFDPAFTGGVRVAAGDLDGAGPPELIATGGGVVKVFRDLGGTFQEVSSFQPFNTYSGPISVAYARPGQNEQQGSLLLGQAEGGSRVAAQSFLVGIGRQGPTLTPNPPRLSFIAFPPAFTGGVRVASGDVNGDGVGEVIVSAGPGGGPHVKVFDGNTATLVQSFFAFPTDFSQGLDLAGGLQKIVVGIGD